jgi:hypothetical protein
MALQFSTGFKDDLLDTGSLKTIFDDGYIAIYSGTVPASPDDALAAAVELVEYSDNGAASGAGNGLDLEAAAAGGALAKASAQVWKGNAGNTGVATFFRYYQLGDTGLLDTTEARIQGTVGGGGADLFVTSTTFTSGVDYTLDMFSISVPDL